MSNHSSPVRLLHSIHAVLLTSSMLLAVDALAQAPRLAASTEIASGSTHLASAPFHVEDVIHVVGLYDKPGGTGDMEIDGKAITLHVHDHATAIPLDSILTFSMVRGDKPLIHGAKGKLAEAAPYGVGFAVTMTRPSAETLTLFYRDSFGAIHGGVLVLPKDTEESVVSAFAGRRSPSGYPSSVYPKSGHLLLAEAKHEPEVQTLPAPRTIKPDVEVAPPSESVDGIPPAFAAAVFEDLIGQLTQSGQFSHVWREGDVRRTPDALVLHLDMESWKQGSARGRGFGPFTGATQIKSNVRLEDRSGQVVFQGKVDNAKRMKGESLDVADGLAKHVRKALEKAPALQASRQQSSN